MGFEVGIDCKVYYDASGVGGSTWAELTIVSGDPTLTMEHAEAEVKVRGNNWVRVLQSLTSATIQMDIAYDNTDAGYEALRNAFLNKTDIGIAMMDGAVESTGSEGLQADMKVMSFNRNEPIEGLVTVSVSLKPSADSDTDPDYVEVSGE